MSPLIARKIVRMISGMHLVNETCAAVGISRNTFYRWVRENESFRRRIERANALVSVRCTEGIMKAAETDWKAAAWLLAWRWPEEFGPKMRLRGARSVARV